MSDFHFLRPEWLWALIPAAVVVAQVWRGAANAGGRGWAGTVDAHLLKHLTVSGAAARPSPGLVAALAAGLLAAVLAIAGPAWEKLPTPTTRGAEPVVVVLSLAQSMNGTDLVPSRLARAGHKLRDILDRPAGEDVGLVIYADRPFVAAPLTPDAAVIREMLPELSTSLMPVLGNRLDLALSKAHELLASAGATQGRILVMADDLGADPSASLAAARAARRDGYAVSVLGVGTAEGAALQTADGRAIQPGGKAAPLAQLDSAAMEGLADAGGGRYAEVTATSADLDRLLPAAVASAQPGRQTDLRADRWQDRGYLLLIIPVLLMPLAFRRGVLFALVLGLAGLGVGAGSARAGGLDDLWATPDQQGARAFAEGDYAAAAAAFAAPEWRAGALYRAGDYVAAAAAFGDDGYNAGNALARAGQFEQALAAYDQHLAEVPDDADAQFNRDLVASLLEQQQQQQQQQQDEGAEQSRDGAASGQDQSEGKTGETGANDDSQAQSAANEGTDQGKQQAGQQGDEQASGSEPNGDGGQPPDAGQSADGAQPGQQPPGSGSDTTGTETTAGDTANDTDGGAQPADAAAGDTPAEPGTEAAQAPDASAPNGTAEATAQTGGTGGDQPDTAMAAEAGTPEPSAQNAGEGKAEPAGDTGTLSALIDRLLQGNGSDEDDGQETGEARAATGTPLSQSAEQQLRTVPDDPAGLLRARIRQHYAQLRANGP